MSTMSKAEAFDLLGDLLGQTPSDNTTLFGEERPKAKAKPRPAWKLAGITLLYKSTTCNCCGTVHTEVNPLVLARETMSDADGNVIKEQSTSNPALLHSKDFSLDDLPTETKYIELRPVPFCVECVEGLASKDLRSLFLSQQKAAIVESAVQTATELAALNEKKAQAEAKLLQLAEAWEQDSPSSFDLDPESF